MIKIKLLILSIFFVTLTSCSTVPITGRKQLNIIPNSTILSMSFQQYNEFIKTKKVSENKTNNELVRKVGENIQRAVEIYFEANNLQEELSDYKWEFNLVEDSLVNAWAMPGGKIVVYTGLLSVTKNESGLAVVLGHEIAHAIAQHGSERMSQALITNLGGMALSRALEEKGEETKALWMTAYGVGTTIGVMLPFSRTHESEADKLGLIFMSIAGYNPHTAIDFWNRMSRLKKGQSPPEFLSTHPSDETRIEDISEFLPEAMNYYNKY